jgi:hypothetical protein
VSIQQGLHSPDMRWWWDGAAWHKAVSDDGRWRWDGSQWTPVPPAAKALPVVNRKAQWSLALALLALPANILPIVGGMAVALVAWELSGMAREELQAGGQQGANLVGFARWLAGVQLAVLVVAVFVLIALVGNAAGAPL